MSMILRRRARLCLTRVLPGRPARKDERVARAPGRRTLCSLTRPPCARGLPASCLALALFAPHLALSCATGLFSSIMSACRADGTAGTRPLLPDPTRSCLPSRQISRDAHPPAGALAQRQRDLTYARACCQAEPEVCNASDMTDTATAFGRFLGVSSSFDIAAPNTTAAPTTAAASDQISMGTAAVGTTTPGPAPRRYRPPLLDATAPLDATIALDVTSEPPSPPPAACNAPPPPPACKSSLCCVSSCASCCAHAPCGAAHMFRAVFRAVFRVKGSLGPLALCTFHARFTLASHGSRVHFTRTLHAVFHTLL